MTAPISALDWPSADTAASVCPASWVASAPISAARAALPAMSRIEADICSVAAAAVATLSTISAEAVCARSAVSYTHLPAAARSASR